MARVVRVLPQVAGGGLALCLLAIVLLHARTPVYLLPPAVDGVAAGAALIGVAASMVAVGAGRTRLFLLGLLLASCLAWGFLLLFEFGFILMAAGIVGAVMMLSRVGDQRRRSFIGAGAGAVLALSLSCLGLLALVGPTVDCSSSGPVISTWSLGFGSASGSSSETSIASNGVATGWVSAGGTTYVFICAHHGLVEFRPDA
jgi:hypothetical protein